MSVGQVAITVHITPLVIIPWDHLLVNAKMDSKEMELTVPVQYAILRNVNIFCVYKYNEQINLFNLI